MQSHDYAGNFSRSLELQENHKSDSGEFFA